MYRNYNCSEENIEAHMSTLVDCHSGCMNSGEQQDATSKDGINQKCAYRYTNGGQGKKLGQTDGRIGASIKKIAEQQSHFSLVSILDGTYRIIGEKLASNIFGPLTHPLTNG